MSRFEIRSLVFALGVAVTGAGFVEASSREHHSNSRDTKSNSRDTNSNEDSNNSTITVTETENEVKLVGAGAQSAARGHAESKVITVTNSATSTTKTNASLSIGVKRLTLADGVVVTFQLNGSSLGTGSVKSGKASLRLSTKKGDTVPPINKGDVVSVIDPDGSTTDLSGTAGASHSQTETSN